MSPVDAESTADILAGQAADADLLAAVYDLEHDGITEDLGFYRAMARGLAVLDLGCGTGRLFATLLAGRARRVVGVDGSPALLRRAAERIARDPQLAAAERSGALRVVHGDVRHLRKLGLGHFGLVVAAGLLPHVDGPSDALRFLRGARARLTRGGRLVIDDLGPALLPARDLPLSVDWRRTWEGRRVIRRSQLLRAETADGLWVAFSTLTELEEADGTITGLPASHRLWYPTPEALAGLVAAAGLRVEGRYGSHRRDPLDDSSERRIFVVRRAREARG